MAAEITDDYYEVLQVSTNAEAETINRVYRLLVQRLHQIISKLVTKADSGH